MDGMFGSVRPLSVRFPVLYDPIVALRCTARWLSRHADGATYAHVLPATLLPHRAKKYASRLVRPLGDSPSWLQEGKIENLRRAIPTIDRIVLQPGESFSFWRLLGRPTARRGFVLGMELAGGRARAGLGGGLCQLATMVHWLALHSPLTVVERSAHSVDPFPDFQRSVPFGTGVAVFYNYGDLRIRNDTELQFQIALRLTRNDLEGELRTSSRIRETYSVFERHHRFVRRDGVVYRENEIWRRVRVRNGGAYLRDELLRRNSSRVLYEVPAGAVEPV